VGRWPSSLIRSAASPRQVQGLEPAVGQFDVISSAWPDGAGVALDLLHGVPWQGIEPPSAGGAPTSRLAIRVYEKQQALIFLSSSSSLAVARRHRAPQSDHNRSTGFALE
jgi:hypothetical protein